MTTAKLFWTGRSQALRLPKEFRFEGSEVRIRREGRSVVIEPVEDDWAWLDRAEPLDDDAAAAALEQPPFESRPEIDEFFKVTRYSLDANAVIAMLKDRTGLVATRARQHAHKDLGVSVIVYHELVFGAYKSVLRDRNARAIAELPFDIMPLDIEDARRAAELRAALAAIGRPIGPYDTMIAGQALARDLILVSANVGEFSRVPRLRLENWAAP